MARSPVRPANSWPSTVRKNSRKRNWPSLTEVLDYSALELYYRLVALLARVVALCIVHPRQKRRANNARGPSGCPHPDGPGSGSSKLPGETASGRAAEKFMHRSSEVRRAGQTPRRPPPCVKDQHLNYRNYRNSSRTPSMVGRLPKHHYERRAETPPRS